MFGRSRFGPVRWALTGAPLLCLLLLPGCSEEYPEDLRYELRTDPVIAVKVSDAVQPRRLDPPGELSTLIDRFVKDFKEKNPGDKKAVISMDDLRPNFPRARGEINRNLRGLFGTPASPRVSALEGSVARALHLDDDTLDRGSRLYRRHCLHCHGLTGNGQGPTGAWVNPHPRDYRLGQFKFISTAQTGQDQKPRRADLLRTLTQGIEGTSMPSFALQSESDLSDLISYVIHLSIRGQVEVETLKAFLVTDALSAESSVEDFMAQAVQDTAALWVEADKTVIKPDKEGVKPGDKDYAESVHRGFVKFTDACKGCHSEFGRRANLFWDNWGTVVRPANLTTGVYRGGRRPIDIYWRIHAGIPGSNMPANYPALNSEQIWDVVNFLQVLPYRAELEEINKKLPKDAQILLDQPSAAGPGH